MKTSGLFTLHRYNIPVSSTTEPIHLVIFGDVHRDSTNFADAKWREFLAYAKTLKNAYFLGMGDYVDSMSTSEREAIAHASLHESTLKHIESANVGHVATLAKELSFMRGRLIGLINGNHFYGYENGINSDQKLCEKLGCKYLGVSTFIRLNFDNHGRHKPFDIWAHHGAGGSRLPGGSINRVDQMRDHAEADCYIMGHDHKRMVVPANPRMHLDMNSKAGMRLQERQSWLIRSGSFLKSYEDGQVSYNVDAARGPSSIGHVELEFRLNRRGELAIRGIQ